MSTTFDAWKKIGLSSAIVIALNVFFYAGLDSFYPAPQYEDYCGPGSMVYKPGVQDEAACKEEGGSWVSPAEGEPFCDMSTVNSMTCYNDYDTAMRPYQRNSFIIFTILGLITLVVSLTLKLPMAVGRGLMYGSVVTLLLGTLFYWSYMEDYLRFIVSGVVLGVLVLVGVKKVKD
jgi:hypothetical protein